MKRIILIWAVLLTLSTAFAQNCPNGKRSWKDFPQEKGEEQPWLEPYDQTYLPYNVCSDPHSVEVVKMEEMVDCFWDEAEGFLETITQDHGFCLFSVVKIVYNVT